MAMLPVCSAYGKGNITFTADAHNVSKDIVVKSTISGQANAILADSVADRILSPGLEI
jgi:hypothetical protein